MLRLTNTSSEPVQLLARGLLVELLPGESHDLHGYEPARRDPVSAERLEFCPSHDPASPRSAEGWLLTPRSDEPGQEPQRSSRARP